MFKRAQVWYTDFLIGLLILIVITFIFTRTILDLNSREDRFQELINDGSSIANSFMSPAYNSNGWINNPPSGRLGFVRDGKIVKNDFDAFLNLLNNNNYEKTKTLLGTRNDYVLYFEFDNNKLSYGGRTIYGKYDDLTKIKADNLIKINRVLYYDLDNNRKIVNMVILVF